MEPLANLNGKQMPLSEVMVPAMDRGFLFGDAVYEVLRVYAGRPFLLAEHMQRLARSLESIRISGVNLDRIRQRVLQTIAAGPFPEAIVYIQVTRGCGSSRSHTFPPQTTPLELLYVQEFADPYKEARESGAGVITMSDIRWERCDIKSTNLLANVLAAQTAKEAGAIEAVFVEADGTLAEGSRTSLFGVLDGKVLTHPTSHAILPGITRSLVLRLAAEADIRVIEKVLKKDDLSRVSELFLTGTTSEVLPIVRVDGTTIGTGRPGPTSRKLQAAYQKVVHETAGG